MSLSAAPTHDPVQDRRALLGGTDAGTSSSGAAYLHRAAAVLESERSASEAGGGMLLPPLLLLLLLDGWVDEERDGWMDGSPLHRSGFCVRALPPTHKPRDEASSRQRDPDW
ncbi:unnamed protein product [Pleuronectes platessa]|uniref:Uncharacterized protein n=1 Tax=Pleuronectes platessa TaxID=8262 RepID=A0A9N7YC16_PLEPL|nr:unnamed protein product [Pleuronectes platessa]